MLHVDFWGFGVSSDVTFSFAVVLDFIFVKLAALFFFKCLQSLLVFASACLCSCNISLLHLFYEGILLLILTALIMKMNSSLCKAKHINSLST